MQIGVKPCFRAMDPAIIRICGGDGDPAVRMVGIVTDIHLVNAPVQWECRSLHEDAALGHGFVRGHVLCDHGGIGDQKFLQGKGLLKGISAAEKPV